MLTVKVDQIERLAKDVFVALGITEEDAVLTAKVLAAADIRGIDSHGIARLPIYAKRLQIGLINKKPDITVSQHSLGIALMDGDNGLGQVVAHRAMDHCIGLAKKQGIAAVGVKNSNHFGIGAYYAMMGLKDDLIGVVCTNTSPLMAPFGGKEAFLGTNPIAIAIPAKDQYPIVLDMATSLVPRGKIEIAARKGEKIPAGWALDAEGRPTQEPAEALSGTLLPMGGPKGYGLALIVDILSGVLTEAAFGSTIGSLFGDLDRPQNIGHFMLAIDPSGFGPVARFKTLIDNLILTIKDSKPAEGFNELFLPGEIEYLKVKERSQKGFELNPAVVAALLQLAKETGLLAANATEQQLFH